MVTSGAFMNRLAAIDNYMRTDDASTISPMVISGTHALDILATAKEAHRNLMLTKALDLSAKRKQPLSLPLSPEDMAAVP